MPRRTEKQKLRKIRQRRARLSKSPVIPQKEKVATW